MRARFSLRHLSILLMAIFILCISTFAMVFWSDYRETISSIVHENNLSLDHTQVLGLLQTMDDVSGELLYAIPYERETFSARFDDAYALAQEYLTHLMQQLDGRRYYYAYDISNMLDSYRREYDVYYETLCAGETAAVYLRGMRTDLGKLNGYIKGELGKAISHNLSYSKENLQQSSMALERTKNYIIIFGGICIFACIFLLEMLFRLVMRPINDLIGRMNSFKTTDQIAPQTEIYHCNEMQVLSDSFDSMAAEILQKQENERRLTRLEIKNMEMQNQLDKARLDMLQAQVNPHFLFNSLNAIYALTIKENAATSGEMIAYLSSILRYSLSSLSSFVQVGHDMDVLSDYIRIQKMRFGEAIRFNISVEDGLEDAEIPCMLIQPLLENAIMHAFTPPSPDDRVDVRVHRSGRNICIVVQDNGSGMSAEQLANIQSGHPRSSSNPDQHHGIGLDNVLKRMDILYGPDSVRIESSPGCGTRITLILSETTQLEE